MMRKSLLLILTCMVMLALQNARAADSDYQAIETAVMNYFDGLRNADRAKLEKAFAKSGAHMKNLGKDDKGNIEVKVTPIADAIDKWVSSGARPELKGRILSVNMIHENAAVATLDFDGRLFDFFQLLRIDGQWKIINKTYIPL